MCEEIQQMRKLLDELDSKLGDQTRNGMQDSFDMFELPTIITSIVDYLHPILLLYGSAVYWYMLRRSILETGDTYVRVSTRGMQKGVLSNSNKSDSTPLSYETVKLTQRGLIDKGVIKQVGDTNREGTQYRVCLPDEIPACKEAMNADDNSKVVAIETTKELDYFNVSENRLKVFERDGYQCKYCDKQLTKYSATLDHIHPVSEGGDNSYDNLVMACLQCHSRKSERPGHGLLPPRQKSST